jgi:hypothetical protein
MKTGFRQEEIREILLVLASRGGCCDCEILFNVAEENRLKSEYWKARVAGVCAASPTAGSVADSK